MFIAGLPTFPALLLGCLTVLLALTFAVADGGLDSVMVAGEALYASDCAACHLPDGGGMGALFPALAGNEGLADAVWAVDVTAGNENHAPVVASYGVEDYASVLSYVRNAWGNEFGLVGVDEVAAVLLGEDEPTAAVPHISPALLALVAGLALGWLGAQLLRGGAERRPAVAGPIRIRGGFDIGLDGAPQQGLREEERRSVRRVAILGRDFPGVRPDFKVEVGDRVRAGDVIFVDRKRPEIAFTAPVSGSVEEINRGHRRSLDSVVLRAEGQEAVSFSDHANLASSADVRALLLVSGLWPAFLTRPFGRIPDPDATAEAIFVTAIDTQPVAPDPMVAIGLREEQFKRGLEILVRLTDGPVFVCHASGSQPPKPADGRVQTVAFSGRHPAGLPSTHIHHLSPVGGGRAVWHVGYQDVIEIGQLVSTGTLSGERIVALAGPGVRDPRLVRVSKGASLDEILEGELKDGSARVITGSVLGGYEARFLGRYHDQVTVLGGGVATSRPVRRRPWSIPLRGEAGGAIVPREEFERVLPLSILAVPLMRALSIGDVETARDLGCLELVEADVSLLSYLCTTGTDYGELLRSVLDDLAGGS